MAFHLPGPVARILDNVLPVSPTTEDCFCGRPGYPSIEFGENLCRRDLENAQAGELNKSKGRAGVNHADTEEYLREQRLL